MIQEKAEYSLLLEQVVEKKEGFDGTREEYFKF
jgi:hypothetical protein